MPKYKKKPIVIEAIKFDGDRHKVLKFCNELISDNHKKTNIAFNRTGVLQEREVYIKTLEGTMTAKYGDYIIKGVNGEFYPCKPDIFHKTYEKVKE